MIKEITNPNIFIKTWMWIWEFKGLATPWHTIYWYDADSRTEKLVRHEMTHIMQMERDGILKFMIMYNWYWITKGYVKNPYEIEARIAENEL